MSEYFSHQYLPALVTLLSLFMYLGTGIAVAAARGKYKVPAPATTGNENFERIFRVQMNTLENLVLFVPALWLFSIYVSPLWAGIIGLVWVLARVDYAVSYARAAASRHRGFATSMTAFSLLALFAAAGIALKMFSA